MWLMLLIYFHQQEPTNRYCVWDLTRNHHITHFPPRSNSTRQQYSTIFWMYYQLYQTRVPPHMMGSVKSVIITFSSSSPEALNDVPETLLLNLDHHFSSPETVYPISCRWPMHDHYTILDPFGTLTSNSQSPLPVCWDEA